MSPESPHDSRRDEQQAHFTQAHIDIAVLRVTVDNQANQLESLAKAVKLMSDELASMNKLLSEAKGGWKVLAGVAGAAGVAGSALSWFVSHLTVFRA